MPNGGLPKSMTSIAIREPGGPDVLVAREQPVPAPGDGEILVRLAAAGVNRPDVMQRQGHYPPPKGATEIPGLEIAGEVVQIGPGVTRWNKGDKVMALVVGGGYAEYCLAFASHALPVPPSLPMIEAARLAQCVRARQACRRRNAARAWRLVWDRHYGYPARQSVRCARHRDRRHAGEMRRLPQARRRSRHQLPHRRLRRFE